MASEITYCREQLKARGSDLTPLEAQAEVLANAPDASFQQEARAFHALADKCDCFGDSDFGALLLESLADVCPDLNRKRRLYEEALTRASIFASYASSGGEGLARSIDVTEIARKLEEIA